MLNLKNHKPSSGGLILLYHRVATLTSDPWQLCVSPERFRQQMQIVRDNCCAVSLAELPRVLQRRARRRPPVAVTFDDGYADNLHEALPVLEQYGIPATFFLTIPWLGQPREFWWDELDRVFLQPGRLPPVLQLASDAEAPTWRLADATQYTTDEAEVNRHWLARERPPTLRHGIYVTLWKRLHGMRPEQRQSVLDEILGWAAIERSERPTHRRMTRDEVIVLSRSRLVEVGAHSATHPALPNLPLSRRKQEISLSQILLAQLADRPVTSFAFPHGDSCPETIRLVREAGFLRACTTRIGQVRIGENDFDLPRFCVGDWDGNEFGERIASWDASCRD